MKSIPALILAVAAAAALGAEPAPPSARELLRPGVPEEIYVAPGRATTVLLHSGRKIAAISLASPIVSYKYDKALNQLEITPTVRSPGVETNLNLRIGPSVWELEGPIPMRKRSSTESMAKRLLAPALAANQAQWRICNPIF